MPVSILKSAGFDIGLPPERKLLVCNSSLFYGGHVPLSIPCNNPIFLKKGTVLSFDDAFDIARRYRGMVPVTARAPDGWRLSSCYLGRVGAISGELLTYRFRPPKSYQRDYSQTVYDVPRHSVFTVTKDSPLCVENPIDFATRLAGKDVEDGFQPEPSKLAQS
jgi:hypothetical protein